MTTYSRRNALAMALAGVGVVAVGRTADGAPEPGPPRPAAGDDGMAVAACPSIPSTADDNVLRIVYEVALDLAVTPRVLLAGFEAGWVESHMNNLPCGDQDSLGVFQQRPSQGWGTPEQIMNVAYASNRFFTPAISIAASNPSWSAGRVAQAVQRSAHPERYDQAESIAHALIERARDLVEPPPLDLWTDSMKLIQAPNRGIALVGAGYYRLLRTDEEVTAAVLLVGNPIVGNDRQFDLWRSIAYDGQVKPPTS